jgi:hypothetical protein
MVGSAEDALFNIPVFGRADRAFYIDRPMYHHRKFDASSTGGHNPHLDEGWERLHDMMSREIAGLGDDFVLALGNRVALGLVGQGINEWYSPRPRAGKIATIRAIISSEGYRAAIRRLDLRRLPPHWQLFFASARTRQAGLILRMIERIERIRADQRTNS